MADKKRLIAFEEHQDLQLRVLARESGLSVNYIVRRAVERFFAAREAGRAGRPDFGLPFEPPNEIDASELTY